jgi:hypothetical protein
MLARLLDLQQDERSCVEDKADHNRGTAGLQLYNYLPGGGLGI